jgi:deoxycytidylate deaminase
MYHKKEYEILDYALQLSKKSTMQNKHGSVIVDKKGNIISTGYNKILCIPKDKIKIYNKNTNIKISKHAEEVALKNADPKKLNGAKLYVIRWTTCNGDTIFTNSKPCKRCTSIIETCIKRFGLKVVYYTK